MTSAGYLDVTPAFQIPRSELVLQFSRSSGAGGQNVNKVNSRVQMRWSLDESSVLPDEVRDQLKSRNRRRINSSGELTITSQRYRDQSRNIEDCLEKLRELVLEALKPPKVRRPTRPTAGSKRRRLGEKRERAQRKQGRRPPGNDD